VNEPAKAPATYEDVLAAPEHMIAEVLAGELYMQPRPAGGHAAAAAALGEELGPPFKRGRGGPGGWLLLDEPELHLGDDILVPDLGGWRRERLPHVEVDQPYIEIAPDWVAEVLSPSTARRDRTLELDAYRREAVARVWLVDPRARTLEVLRRTDDGWRLVGTWADGANVRAEPFDAIELDLAVLWADVAPAEATR
jgi:Uma2 family endonuclease